MTSKREQAKRRRANKAEAKANAKAQAAFNTAVEEHARAEAAAIATKQYIALNDSEHSKRCPVTGKAVDPARAPKNIVGPYFSKPFGLPGLRRRSTWSISPVTYKAPDGRINPCVSVMWARVEVDA